MREIIITIDDNKSIKISNTDFGNLYDNKITKVKFELDELYKDIANKYVALRRPDKTVIIFPLNDDNSFIISNSISNHPGSWSVLFLGTNTEIDESGDIDNTGEVIVSDEAKFNITDNFLTDPIPTEEEIEENLKVLYDDLNQTAIYLKSEEFKELVKGDKGLKGDDGKGILEVEKTSTVGLIDTYTITFTDETTFDFEITNGKDGINGADGENGTDGIDGLNTYEIWLNNGNIGTEEDFLNSLKGENGTDGINGLDGIDGKSAYQSWLDLGNTGTEQEFINSLKGSDGIQGEQGPKGDIGEKGLDGKGILSIEKTSTVDLIDTYTITFTDLTTTTFDIKNGEQGPKGIQGEQGVQGIQGEQGPKGDIGEKGLDGINGKSAYEIYYDNIAGVPMTETEYNNALTSLGDLSVVLDNINGEVI